MQLVTIKPLGTPLVTFPTRELHAERKEEEIELLAETARLSTEID